MKFFRRSDRHYLPIILLSIAIATCGQAFADERLEGAWLAMEVTDSTGNVDAEPHPGLLIFTAKHYSIMYTTGQKPRAVLDENPNDAQTIAAYETLVANTGRYSVSGDKIMTRAFVAKHPNYMSDWPENQAIFTYSLVDDRLILVAEGGPAAGFSTTYRKVEGEAAPWE